MIAETLRLYPLFGIAHRITSADIAVDEARRSRGLRALLQLPGFHRAGFDEPDAFRPDRWEDLLARAMPHFIPFGVAGNRPCPARGIAPITMRVVDARGAAAVRARLLGIAHALDAEPRTLPGRLARRRAASRGCALLLAFMRVRDRWEDVWRSLVQLVLGTYMVWDARRLRLCERHFESSRSNPRVTR